jgi:hypothetical protein
MSTYLEMKMKELSAITEQTMTLKEITDLLDVRHNDAMGTVARMAEEPSFGTATKISYQYTKGQGATGPFELGTSIRGA